MGCQSRFSQTQTPCWIAWAGGQGNGVPLVTPGLQQGCSSHWSLVQLKQELQKTKLIFLIICHLWLLQTCKMLCHMCLLRARRVPSSQQFRRMRHFSSNQIKGALPLHRANISLGCHATGAQVFDWSLWLTSTKNLKACQQAQKSGSSQWGEWSIVPFLCRQIIPPVLPCRRPTGAVADNLTGCPRVPWGPVWLQELWGKQGHTVC